MTSEQSQPLSTAASASASASTSTSVTPQEIFDSSGWKIVKEELDTIPLFCCANEKGQPVQYKINKDTTMPFFYCTPTAVEEELQKAKQHYDSNNQQQQQLLHIIPFPLGTAFELMVQNQAAIIPDRNALEYAIMTTTDSSSSSSAAAAAAAAPVALADQLSSSSSLVGQQVPLFCCMDIMQTIQTHTHKNNNNNNKQKKKHVLPIFMDYKDAQAAINEARLLEPKNGHEDDDDRNDGIALEIEILNLPRAVELLASTTANNNNNNNDDDNDTTSPAFCFLPSKASIDYIHEYLEK